MPEKYPSKAIGEIDKDISPDYFNFIDGQRVTIPDRPFVFDVELSINKLEGYDCICNNGDLPLVGPRMQALLNAHCSDDIQYLPAIIRCTDGMVKSYKAINITHCVDAIDYQKSTCSTIELDSGSTAVLSVQYLVFNPNPMSGLSLARDSHLTSYLVVSQKLHDLIQENRITGIQLKTADESNNLMNLIRGR